MNEGHDAAHPGDPGEPADAQRRRAIALRYDAEREQSPRVVASGAGHLAQRILELAEAHGVHVHSDPDLTALLAKLDLNTEIPPELYRAIAEILAFVYRLNQEAASPSASASTKSIDRNTNRTL